MRSVKALLLAAGLGTRLRPLTDVWPKCLMPIQKRPLLEYWLWMIRSVGIKEVMVNLHHLPQEIAHFLAQPQFHGWVQAVNEKDLLGTAGTLRENKDFFSDGTTLLVHADNWCHCDFKKFIQHHEKKRPRHTRITMMTFRSETPESCGVLELDKDGVVQGFYEKVKNPPGNLANAAVYLLEPDVLTWIIEHPHVRDFSTQVLPHFVGKISTWENCGIHRDIGTLVELKNAQKDAITALPVAEDSAWENWFRNHSIHQMVKCK